MFPHGIHCFLYYFINCIKCIQFCTYIVLTVFVHIYSLLLCIRRVNCPIANPRLGFLNTSPSIVVLCLKNGGRILGGGIAHAPKRVAPALSGNVITPSALCSILPSTDALVCPGESGQRCFPAVWLEQSLA